jgi:hypothetical protein
LEKGQGPGQRSKGETRGKEKRGEGGRLRGRGTASGKLGQNGNIQSRRNIVFLAGPKKILNDLYISLANC